jgi:hypothetical protein
MSAAPIAQLLIVDDEAALMKALCHTLEDQGYGTTGFTLASEALGELRARQFDLLLTDLMMPEMDGISLLRAAQEIDRHLVGIVMTGHGAIDSAVEAMKAGALDYILKPFKLRTILPVLSRALVVRRLRIENFQLVERVRIRTAELEHANQELEAFSYSVSHDLRAPLRAIDGFCSILVENHAPSLPEPVPHYLQRTRDAALRMGRLIDDLLNLSRISGYEIQRSRVNLSQLAQRILDELKAGAPNRQVDCRVAPGLSVDGDPNLLHLALDNLLRNAWKFTANRPVARIEVSVTEQQGEVVYFVRDNGAGFDMAYAGKLFGAFQRLHRAAEFEGTGIGLAIVRRVITRHGGRIWSEASENEGATFFFTLPKPLA